MIYALYDFDADDWVLIGDYQTVYDVIEYWDLLCSSKFYSSRTLALWSVGTFDRSTGAVIPAVNRRIATHSPQGGSCGGNLPPQVVPCDKTTCGETIGFGRRLGNRIVKLIHFQKQKNRGVAND